MALAGAGAGASNTVSDNTYAYIQDCQNVLNGFGQVITYEGVTATTGNVALSATDGPSIFSTTHGGSVAFAVSPESASR